MKAQGMDLKFVVEKTFLEKMVMSDQYYKN